MKNVLAFFKLTAMGGLLVLLPILLFILLLTEIVNLVVGLATPIADLFPPGTFDDPEHPVALAVILLVGASLLIGIAMKSKTAIWLGGWLQAKTVGNLPLYRFVKSLVSGLIGADKADNFKPALLDAGNGQREFVYVVEDLGNGELISLCPHAPSGFVGPLKIVPAHDITRLDASLGEISLVFNHMGLGAGRLLKMKGIKTLSTGEKLE